MVVLPRFYIKAISSFPLSVLSQSWIRSRHKLVNWVLRQTVSLAPNINWHISQTESLSAFPILTLTSQLCFIVQGHMTQNQNIHTGESVLFCQMADCWKLIEQRSNVSHLLPTFFLCCHTGSPEINQFAWKMQFCSYFWSRIELCAFLPIEKTFHRHFSQI